MLAACLCALIAAVYESFSHEVYSYYMLFAFAVPLAGGALPLLALVLAGRQLPGRLAVWAWSSGIAALTVGSMFKGALDIYGTTSRLLIVYPVIASVMMCLGLVLYIASLQQDRTAAGNDIG
ncbi:MAG: hypothetical protein IJS22_05765 [Lachnospiraceae bacterium]|nr:hypothetical protein [Lachnospiraceae bacterium]